MKDWFPWVILHSHLLYNGTLKPQLFWGLRPEGFPNLRAEVMGGDGEFGVSEAGEVVLDIPKPLNPEPYILNPKP